MANSKPKNLNLCQISHLNVSVNINHRLKLPRQRSQYVFRCEKRKNTKAQRTAQLATSILVTGVGDEMCWRQL